MIILKTGNDFSQILNATLTAYFFDVLKSVEVELIRYSSKKKCLII